MSRSLYFIGVTTAQSSIMRIYPRWAERLGLADTKLAGRDLPPGAGPAAYRRVVDELAADPEAAGALVTTHKIDLLRAARDRFASLDEWAKLCSEVSCIVKRDAALHGYALDPVSSGLTLDAMLGLRYWARTGAAALLLGAGGATTAITAYLLSRPDQTDHPSLLIAVDRDRARLDALRAHGDAAFSHAGGVRAQRRCRDKRCPVAATAGGLACCQCHGHG